MRKRRPLIGLCLLLACGLLAAGCGDDEESSTAATTETAPTETGSSATSTDDSAPQGSGEGGSASEMIDADGVYDACLAAVEDAPSDEQERAQVACRKARSTFEDCAEQAEATDDESAGEAAIEICRKAAERAVAALEATG